MARIEKGTRAKMLPARIAINVITSNSGSYPTRTRTVSNGQLGPYRSFYDDSGFTTVFDVTRSIYAGSGLPTNSKFLNPELLTTLQVTGIVRKSSFDNAVVLNNSFSMPNYLFYDDSGKGVVTRTGNWSPRDYDNGTKGSNIISDSVNSYGYNYYLTGSEVTSIGQGFTQPLRDKNSIKIDISCNTFCSLSIISGSGRGPSFETGYYDFSQKKWLGIGGGETLTQFTANTVSGLQPFFQNKPFGFGPAATSLLGQVIPTTERRYSARAIDSFGFPWHEKFIPPTASMYYAMSNSITEPFLLEKFTVEFSSSFSSRRYNNNTADNEAYITTVFLMNNRRNQENVNASAIVTGFIGTGGTASITSVHSRSLLDLVGYAQISCFQTASSSPTNGLSGYVRENNISNVMFTTSGSWNQTLFVEGVCKYTNPTNKAPVFLSTNASNYVSFGNQYGGRNNLPVSNGRNWVSPFPTKVTSTTIPLIDGSSAAIPETPDRFVPYLLLPNDYLFIGIQLPMLQNMFAANAFSSSFLATNPNDLVGDGPTLAFPANVKATLTLYGSLLEMGPDGFLVEKHTYSNRPLTSMQVSEPIGDCERR